MKSTKRNREVKRIFDTKLLEDPYCRGCETPNNLTASHTIKRSRRPDLITEPDNILPLCIKCHSEWEIVESSYADHEYIRSMFCYEEMMDYVKLEEPRMYSNILLAETLN